VSVSNSAVRLPARSGQLAVFVGMATSQLSGYALNLVATRQLGPASYGALAAILTVSLIVSVPSLALQSLAARSVAHRQDQARVGERRLPGLTGDDFLGSLLGIALIVSLASTAVAGIATAVLTPALNLALPWQPLFAAATVAPLALIALGEGVLQGQGRLRALGWTFLIVGVSRLGFGVAGLAVSGRPSGVLAGIAVGGVAGATAALGVARVRRSQRSAGSGWWRQLGSIAAAMGGLLVLANIDVILARATLASGAAGLYAAGALVSRAAYWGPQFVAVSVFARLTHPAHGYRLLLRAASAVAGIGACGTILAAVAGPWLLPKVLGSAYSDIGGVVWIFALSGSLLALCQLFVTGRVARRDDPAATLPWVAALFQVVLIGGWLHGSVVEIATATLSVNALLLCLLAARTSSHP
jgi:O-antigen/teichoic acid export membrane protein